MSNEATLYHTELRLHTSDLDKKVSVELLSDVHQDDHIRLFHLTLVLSLGVLGDCTMGRCRNREVMRGYIHHITSPLHLNRGAGVGLAALLGLLFRSEVGTLLVFVGDLDGARVRVLLSLLHRCLLVHILLLRWHRKVSRVVLLTLLDRLLLVKWVGCLTAAWVLQVWLVSFGVLSREGSTPGEQR
jgi:hypothetical protein